MKTLLTRFEFPRYLRVFWPYLGAITVALAVAGCATPDNRTAQERANDAAVARRIEAALTAEPYVDANHVSVEVRRGTVALSGTVGDAADLQRVLRVCYAVPGVVRVDDQIGIVDFNQNWGASNGHAR